MASGLNSTERTIISSVSYVVALVVSIVMYQTNIMLLTTVVFIAFVFPLLFGTRTLHLRGSLLVGAGISITGLSLLLFFEQGTSSIISLIAFPLSYMSASGLIGWLNERNQAKRAMWQQPRSLKDRYDEEIFEPALNIFHFIDREGTVVRRNEASRTAIGHPTRRSLQLAEYVHPSETTKIKTELIRLFDRGEIRSIETRFVSEDKKSFPVEIRGTRINERLAIIEARDRSAEVNLERQIMETEAPQRLLIEDSIDTLDSAIILTDSKGQVIWANAAIGTFFGIDRERLIGVNAKRALERYVGAFEDAQTLSTFMAEAIERKERIDSIVCRVRPTLSRAERVLEFRSIPIEKTDRYKGGRIDHYIDITELKQLEETLREKTRNLERSNEKLEEFSHVVSHDLKEPLRTVETFSGFLLEDYEDKLDAEGVDYLNTLKRTSSRMRQLINDLLSLASIHMDTKSFDRINTQRMLEEIHEDLEIRLRGVNLQVATDLPPVKGSRVRIGELFSNLIVNGIKYNDKALPMIRVGWKQDTRSNNNSATFFVEDNGIGIESRYQERVFGIFEKLNPRDDYEGTGAGLAICKRIVEEHGGTIWVESEVGKGSTFYFTIPRAREVDPHA
ncbi:PAS domain-containing protein [Candidatus Bipolaricaulota bacterium]|nr:PAS domain-containing protein [Candidatus Bipolaricaulota bacterium]